MDLTSCWSIPSAAEPAHPGKTPVRRTAGRRFFIPPAPAEIESGEFDARTISAAACPVARSRTLAYHTFRRPNQHSNPGTGQSTVATFASRPPPHVSLPAATLFSLVEAVTASTAAQPPVSATISAIAAGTAATRKLFRSRNSSFLPLFQFATGRKYPHTRL